MRYFDTGVILKLYLPELRAAEAVALVDAGPGKPPVSHLHELEMRSALRQKTGRGELTQTECDALIAEFEADLAAGVHDRVAVSWPDVFATAEALSAAHGVTTLCRSLDTLHVALALIHQSESLSKTHFLLGRPCLAAYQPPMTGIRREASFHAVFAPDHERALYPGQMPRASH